MKNKKKLKKLESSDEVQYKEGDLVGAKIKGHPLWPGCIEKVDFVNNRRRYTVRFFGSNDTGQSFMQIKYFKDFTSKEKACTRKGFKDALSLCQEEYDSLKATKNVSPSRSAASSPMPDSTSPAIREQNMGIHGNDNDDEKIDDNEDDKTAIVSSTTLNTTERDDSQTIITKSLESKGDNMQQSGSPKSEGGENVVITPVMQTTVIEKLSNKVAMKLKEKEAQKEKKKEMKLIDKISAKLVRINENLYRFSMVSGKLSDTNSVGQIDIVEWNAAVREYKSVYPSLAKCIEKVKKHCKSSNSVECHKFHETLRKVAENLKKAKNNDQVPKKIKDELKKFIEKMKNEEVNSFVNEFEFENLKNAMLERKENDA